MDALASLLVHVDSTPRAEARLRIARRLAEAHGASLTAFYAAAPVVTEMDLEVEVAAGATALTLLREVDDVRRRAALSTVDRVRAEAGAKASIAWEESDLADPIDATMRRALYADLVVLGQHEPSTPTQGVPTDFVESVIVGSGTPALVLPYIETGAAPGTCVLVAWNETPSCAHALSAAWPLVRSARRVHVVGWGRAAEGGALDRAGEFLRQHGVSAEVHRPRPADADVGERMLSLAAELSADLMVMGCYGHSRALELVLGGATRTFLRSMTLPVLMAH